MPISDTIIKEKSWRAGAFGSQETADPRGLEFMFVQIRAFQDEDGAWCATGVDHGIHTQGNSLDDLFANIDEATRLHFEDELATGRTIDVLVTVQKEFAGAPASGR